MNYSKLTDQIPMITVAVKEIIEGKCYEATCKQLNFKIVCVGHLFKCWETCEKLIEKETGLDPLNIHFIQDFTK